MTNDTNQSAPLIPHPPLKQYYEEESQRRGFVSRLFDDTASEYDWIIRAMSFGSGEWYRKTALIRAGLKPGKSVLDVATGTGPVAKGELSIVGESGQVIGLDRSINMLGEARRRAGVPVVHAGAEELPFPDNSFDFLSMGYALRHVNDLRALFREYHRVLRPGGKVLVLEMTRPRSSLGFSFARFYLHKVVPWMARIGSGKQESETLMKYFWDTIENCVPPEAILQAMAEGGLVKGKRHRVFGIFSEYTAVKPG